MNDLEAVIGGKEWEVGQIVRWLRPDGQWVERKIVNFKTNTRTGEIMAVLDNQFAFGAEDIERGHVQEVRRG